MNGLRMRGRVCPLCGSTLILEDGLLVCSSCGYIVDADLLPDTFNENHFTNVGRSRSLEIIVSRLGLPNEVYDLAKDIVSSYELASGERVTPSILMAAVIIASRIYGTPVPIKEAILRVSARTSPSRVALAIGKLESVLPRREGVPWEGYINYLIGKMSRDERFMDRLKIVSGKLSPYLVLERLRIRAIKELRDIRKKKRADLIGRNPVYIAAAVIYMTSKRIGIRGISQGLLADVLGTSRSTISKALGVVR